MDALHALEEKIARLVELVKKYKDENIKLAEEKAELTAKLKSMESSLMDDSKEMKRLSQEKEQTRLAVDDLIGVIDLLVETENQQK